MLDPAALPRFEGMWRSGKPRHFEIPDDWQDYWANRIVTRAHKHGACGSQRSLTFGVKTRQLLAKDSYEPNS